MNDIKIGSLFSGYGGLEMGVQAAIGGRTVWHVEFDENPSKILAHHWPDVPNYGDVSKVKWTPDCPVCGRATAYYTNASVFPERNEYYCRAHGWFDVSIRLSDPDAARIPEPVAILTGGFPCQDVSLAGLRKGLRDGTRSGLWSEFARAINALRPELVVIENVRGLLSAEADSRMEHDPWLMGNGSGRTVLRALGAVLGDLADLGYDARWCGLRAADAGAPHGRFRVFIVAHPAGQPWRFRNGDDVSAWSDEVGREPLAGRSAAADAEYILGDRPGRARDGRPKPSDCASADAGRSRLGEHSRAASSEEAGQDDRDVVAGARRTRSDQDRGQASADADSAGLRSVGRQRPRKRHADGRYRADTAWGPYEPAVRRWEAVSGRVAPEPTQISESYPKRLKRRRASRLPVGMRGPIPRKTRQLAPAFVEWMMGLPEGHVTGAGLKRNDQLKALGNGVVPQQAELALQVLLNRQQAAA